MARSRAVVEYIREELKVRGITYLAFSEKLGISESGVKQMFAANNFSITRLDEICDILDMEMSDLVALSAEKKSKTQQFTDEQEKTLLSDMKLAAIAYAAINHHSSEEIQCRYELSDTELVSYLVRLDKIGLIALHTNNRIKPLLSSSFRWRRNGPVEAFIQSDIIPEIFNSNFTGDGDQRIFVSGYLSPESKEKLNNRVLSVIQLFKELCLRDSRNSQLDREHVAFVVGLRSWIFSRMEAHHKKPFQP